jgi:hypothetical protein
MVGIFSNEGMPHAAPDGAGKRFVSLRRDEPDRSSLTKSCHFETEPNVRLPASPEGEDGRSVVTIGSRAFSFQHCRDLRKPFVEAMVVSVTWQMRQICEYAFMRTTVDLPDALFKRVKSEAALRGMRLREFIAQALEQSLAGHRDDLKSRRVRLPLIRGSGGPPINLTREQVDAGIWE